MSSFRNDFLQIFKLEISGFHSLPSSKQKERNTTGLALWDQHSPYSRTEDIAGREFPAKCQSIESGKTWRVIRHIQVCYPEKRSQAKHLNGQAVPAAALETVWSPSVLRHRPAKGWVDGIDYQKVIICTCYIDMYALFLDSVPFLSFFTIIFLPWHTVLITLPCMSLEAQSQSFTLFLFSAV